MPATSCRSCSAKAVHMQKEIRENGAPKLHGPLPRIFTIQPLAGHCVHTWADLGAQRRSALRGLPAVQRLAGRGWRLVGPPGGAGVHVRARSWLLPDLPGHEQEVVGTHSAAGAAEAGGLQRRQSKAPAVLDLGWTASEGRSLLWGPWEAGGRPLPGSAAAAAAAAAPALQAGRPAVHAGPSLPGSCPSAWLAAYVGPLPFLGPVRKAVYHKPEEGK